MFGHRRFHTLEDGKHDNLNLLLLVMLIIIVLPIDKMYIILPTGTLSKLSMKQGLTLPNLSFCRTLKSFIP